MNNMALHQFWVLSFIFSHALKCLQTSDKLTRFPKNKIKGIKGTFSINMHLHALASASIKHTLKKENKTHIISPFFSIIVELITLQG